MGFEDKSLTSPGMILQANLLCHCFKMYQYRPFQSFFYIITNHFLVTWGSPRSKKPSDNIQTDCLRFRDPDISWSMKKFPHKWVGFVIPYTLRNFHCSCWLPGSRKKPTCRKTHGEQTVKELLEIQKKSPTKSNQPQNLFKKCCF